MKYLLFFFLFAYISEYNRMNNKCVVIHIFLAFLLTWFGMRYESSERGCDSNISFVFEKFIFMQKIWAQHHQKAKSLFFYLIYNYMHAPLCTLIPPYAQGKEWGTCTAMPPISLHTCLLTVFSLPLRSLFPLAKYRAHSFQKYLNGMSWQLTFIGFVCLFLYQYRDYTLAPT